MALDNNNNIDNVNLLRPPVLDPAIPVRPGDALVSTVRISPPDLPLQGSFYALGVRYASNHVNVVTSTDPDGQNTLSDAVYKLRAYSEFNIPMNDALRRDILGLSLNQVETNDQRVLTDTQVASLITEQVLVVPLPPVVPAGGKKHCKSNRRKSNRRKSNRRKPKKTRRRRY